MNFLLSISLIYSFITITYSLNILYTRLVGGIKLG